MQEEKTFFTKHITIIGALLLVFFINVPSYSQMSDKFYNLKVLPKMISRPELLSIMRGFTSALDVRCEFCHAEGQDGRLDFSSDAKPNKDKAREMLRMVQNINDNYISKIAEMSKDTSNEVIKVQCVTCHHGQPVPQTLQAVMMKTINKQGVDSAIAQYHDLYNKYYGGFSYDFKDHSLVELSEQLIDAQKPADAVAISKLNLQMYPNSGVAFYGMGEAYEANNDKQNAITYYQKAFAQMPNDRRLEKKIQDLQNQ
jgi:Photosynthetic reaction centre cytochrome C subunit